MSEDIIVPSIGAAITEVTILEWLVEDGDLVAAGDPLLVVETEKVETELESPASGVVRRSCQPQDVCAVGSVIGTIDEP